MAFVRVHIVKPISGAGCAFFCIAPPLKPFHSTQRKHRFHEHGFWFLGEKRHKLTEVRLRRRSFEFQLLVVDLARRSQDQDSNILQIAACPQESQRLV